MTGIKHFNRFIPSGELLRFKNLHKVSFVKKCDQKTFHFSTALSELSKESQAEFDVLRAQVAINQGDEDSALSLASKALDELPESFYYAQIVATSVIGEALHCHGNLTEALSMLQSVEKTARYYHTYHNILWSLIQKTGFALSLFFHFSSK